MLKKKWFLILLLISLGFEAYMMLTYNSTYSTMLNKENPSAFIVIFNLIYTTFVVACFYKGHFWSGLFIFMLSFIRDLILIPKGIYSPAFALADSVICVFIMIAICRKEYYKIKNSNKFTPAWTEENIHQRSVINDSFITTMTQKFYNYNTDPQEADRKAEHHCKFCEYVQDKVKVGIELKCLMCGQELSNEHITKLCPECAQKHDACVCCGGKMN